MIFSLLIHLDILPEIEHIALPDQDAHQLLYCIDLDQYKYQYQDQDQCPDTDLDSQYPDPEPDADLDIDLSPDLPEQRMSSAAIFLPFILRIHLNLSPKIERILLIDPELDQMLFRIDQDQYQCPDPDTDTDLDLNLYNQYPETDLDLDLIPDSAPDPDSAAIFLLFILRI